MKFFFKGIFFILLYILGIALLWSLSRKLFPFTLDSLVYISTAQHIHYGQGLVCTNFFLERSMQDTISTSLQPPGYPILISFFMLFGFNGYTAGLLVPRICFLILPYLFYLIFKRLMPSAQAMVGAFVCTFMFSAIKCALIAWSEIPCLCFSLMALLAAFHIIENGKKMPPLLVLLSGVLAGYVYLIRFVGMSLIASIVIGFMACWILKMMSKKEFFKIISVYVAGAGLVVVPFLYRNWHVFGKIQTFRAPPSQTPLAENIKYFLGNIATMLWTKPSITGLVALFIIAAVAFIVIKSKKMIETDMKAFIFTIVLMAYFLINSIVLFTFQTLWFCSEKIDDRYLIPVIWILMVAVVVAMDIGIDSLKKIWDLKKMRIAGALLMVFISIQVVLAQDFLKGQERMLAFSRIIERYAHALRTMPKDVVIVTNFPDLVYYYTQHNVRMLNNYTPYMLGKFMAPRSKYVVFLVKGGWNPEWNWGSYGLEWGHPKGYTRIFSDEQVDLFVPGV
jgi:hypothetical protein